jgi:prepilin-type processing-associated H-X9-DG protein
LKRKHFICPGRQGTSNPEMYARWFSTGFASSGQFHWAYSDYAYSYPLANPLNGVPRVRINQITRPTKILALGDSAQGNPNSRNCGYYAFSGIYSAYNPVVWPLHNAQKNANVAYVDGHVATLIAPCSGETASMYFYDNFLYRVNQAGNAWNDFKGDM